MVDDADTARSAALTRGTIARYAAGSIGAGGFATLPGLVLTYYLTDSLGVTALAAGVILAAARLWDVVADPVVGALTDADRARHGSRRRLMRTGALAFPVLFALTFAVPPGLSPAVSATWAGISFLLAVTAFSLFQVPYVALPAELTDRYDERTRLLTGRVVVLTVAALVFGAGGPVLRGIGEPATGHLVMGVVAGITMGLGMLVATAVAGRARLRLSGMAAAATAAAEQAEIVGEQVLGDEAHGFGRDAASPGGGIRDNFRAAAETLRRSQPFRALLATVVLQALAAGLMLTGAQYLATWVVGSEDAVTLLFAALVAPALVAAPAWGDIARRVGKERALAIATALFAVAALTAFVAARAPGAWIYASVAAVGLAYAGMQSLPMAMLADVIGYDARRHGPGRAGAFGGVWTAAGTAGIALGATALTIVLAATGYIASTGDVVPTQPDAAVNGIVVGFSIIPAALVLLSLAPLARYRLRRADVDGVL